MHRDRGDPDLASSSRPLVHGRTRSRLVRDPIDEDGGLLYALGFDLRTGIEWRHPMQVELRGRREYRQAFTLGEQDY